MNQNTDPWDSKSQEIRDGLIAEMVSEFERLLEKSTGTQQEMDEILILAKLLVGATSEFGISQAFTEARANGWRDRVRKLIEERSQDIREVNQTWHSGYHITLQELTNLGLPSKEFELPELMDVPPLMPGRIRVYPYASHCCFRLYGDRSSDQCAEDSFIHQLMDDRIAWAEGETSVATDSYYTVPVDFELLNESPKAVDSFEWDIICDVSLAVRNEFTIRGGIDGEYLMIAANGSHRMRIHVKRATDESVRGCDNDMHVGDYYLIQLWPDKPMLKTFLKR